MTYQPIKSTGAISPALQIRKCWNETEDGGHDSQRQRKSFSTTDHEKRYTSRPTHFGDEGMLI